MILNLKVDRDGLGFHAEKDHVDHAFGIVAEDVVAKDCFDRLIDGVVFGDSEESGCGAIEFDDFGFGIDGEAGKGEFVERGSESFEGGTLDGYRLVEIDAEGGIFGLKLGDFGFEIGFLFDLRWDSGRCRGLLAFQERDRHWHALQYLY